MEKFHNFFAKIAKFLNLKIDNNQKWILGSLIVSGLICTYISPTMTKEIVSKLPAQWLAFESVVGSVSGLLIGIMWQGAVRKKAINNFILFISCESLCGFVLALYLLFISYNVWVLAIASLIYTSLISTFVGKCIMAFKAKIWIEQDREIYDNNSSIVGGIVCIVGFTSALLFLPSVKLSIFLWGFSCLIDNIGWGVVYYRNRVELKKLGDNE